MDSGKGFKVEYAYGSMILRPLQIQFMLSAHLREARRYWTTKALELTKGRSSQSCSGEGTPSKRQIGDLGAYRDLLIIRGRSSKEAE